MTGTRAPSLLFLVAALAWAFEVWTARNMGAPLVRLMMPMSRTWTLAEAAAVWVMWVVMMLAMMLPSATPMILMHRRLVTRRGAPQDTWAFVLAYAVTLAGFSLVAAGLQWGLQALGVLVPMGGIASSRLAGAVLILAGVVQWLPLKDRCLTACRTPIGFFATEFLPGFAGSFRMGLRHGLTCLGCCWALMALLFVFGVMNLTAIILLSVMVAAEKLLPRGQVLARAGGVVLLLWGGYLILD